MIFDATTIIGTGAAFCTTASYFPQLKKCWETGSAEDLSLHMYLILLVGISLWIAYGIMRADPLIIIANAVSLACLLAIIVFKLRH